MISKGRSALLLTGDFSDFSNPTASHPPGSCWPLHALLFFLLSLSSNWAIAAYFLFFFLTYSQSLLLSQQCMVCLCFDAGARKRWAQVVQGCFMALPLALCGQPKQSGPLFHVLEMSLITISLSLLQGY